VTDWVPQPGDLVWVDFSPISGTEQAGRRPALVLSDAAFNESSGRAVVLPVTSRMRRRVFDVALPEGSPIDGAILADQVRTIDWRARFAKLGGTVSPAILDEARAKLAALIGLS
jgi:mRNA interferase MazF